MNNERQMGLALDMYVGDNQEYPDYSRFDSTSVTGAIWWFQSFQPYYPLAWTNRAYHCPGYKGTNSLGDSDGTPSYGSYAYNAIGAGFGDDLPGFPVLGLGLRHYDGPTNAAVTRESQVKVPSEMYAIGESKNPCTVVWGNPVGAGWDVLVLDYGYPATFLSHPPRHGRNYNMLFCDGHVRAGDPKVMYGTGCALYFNLDHEPHPEAWW